MFVLDHNELKSALNTVIAYTAKRPSLDILKDIKVVYKDQECTLYATDLEVYIGYKLPVAIPCLSDEEIAFIIPEAREFAKSIKIFGNEIKFSISETGVTITDGKNVISFARKAITDYPDDTWVSGYGNTYPYKYKVNGIELHNQYQKIKHAICKDDTRYILQSVLIDCDWMVALDGYQMAVIPLDSTLPVDVLASSRMLDNCNIMGDDATLVSDNNRFVLTNNKHYIAGCTIDAKYPQYTSVIPEIGSHSEAIVFNRKEMIGILNLFMVQGLKKNPNRAVIFEDGVMSFQISEFDDNIVKSSLSNEIKNTKISFNGERLLNSLRTQFTNETIYMSVWNSDRPIIIEDNIAENGFHLIMPIFIDKK